MNTNGQGVDREEEFSISANIVPFVLVGKPTAAPHWFDDVERIQAAMLNLESAHHENLIKCVFPQLVIPDNTIMSLMNQSNKTFDEAVELIRGIEWPFVEAAEAKNLTRYLMPAAVDIKAIPDELTRRRTELFEIVGQALRDQGAQAQSAASKAWDHRDVEATLADNAEAFEEAEAKAVAISKMLDTSFGDYAPSYPRKFDLPDLEADWRILVELEGSGGLPESIVREIAKVKVEVLDRIHHLDPEVKAQAMQEIDDMDTGDLMPADLYTPPEGGQADDQDDEEDPEDEDADDDQNA
jgi:hypothetical protein